MKKNGRVSCFLRITAVSFLAGVFCLSACNKKESDESKVFELIPEVIDEATIQTIPNYDEIEKKQIVDHYSREAFDTDLHGEEENTIVEKFAEEVEQYNNLTVVGDNFDIIDYNETSGISFSGSMVGFTFLQNIEKSYEFMDKTIEIYDSSSKKASSYSLPNKIRNGAFIISKSFDQNEWTTEATVLSENRSYVTYFPDSEDVTKGVYYQFINITPFKFFSHYEEKTSGILWWKKTKQIEVYSTFNLIQKYDVTLAKTSIDLRFTCEAIANPDVSSEELTEEEIEIVQNSTTMTDGSVSTSYIKAELGSSYTINYSFIDGSGTHQGTFNETTTFNQPGKYSFTVSTFFGETTTTTLFLVDLKNDNGKTTFFGDGLLDSSKRMYDPTKTVQTYLVGKEYHLIELSSYLPGRYGNILYFRNEEDLKNNVGQIVKTFEGSREQLDGVFSMKGYYIFDLFVCDPATSSGDILRYQYVYYISNNTAYEPFVNYGLITNPARSNLLATKVIAVSLPTTGGGDYQFIYPYTEKYIKQAYNMAVEIEELNVEIKEKSNKKYYFYKSADNPNITDTYTDKAYMYEILNAYAKKNVNVIYIDNELPFADEVVDSNIKNLSERTIRNTIRIVEDDATLADLRTGDIYLNNYVFTQIADFEVESITAVGENNNQYNIEFDKEIDSLFSKSDKVTITEKNWNKERIYQTIYSKNNTCKLSIEDNFIKRTIDIDNDGETITTASFKFVMASDAYDSQTLIAINDGKTRTLFSMEEIAGLSLPIGQYEVSVINRNKQTYHFNVNRIVDLIGDEQSYASFDHHPLKKIIDDSNAEPTVETTKRKNVMPEMAIWVFVLIIVGAVLVSAIITFVIMSLIIGH